MNTNRTILLALPVALCLATGCETREKVLDVETPGGGVEIHKTSDGVDVDIDHKKGEGTSIDIDAPGVEIKKTP